MTPACSWSASRKNDGRTRWARRKTVFVPGSRWVQYWLFKGKPLGILGLFFGALGRGAACVPCVLAAAYRRLNAGRFRFHDEPVQMPAPDREAGQDRSAQAEWERLSAFSNAQLKRGDVCTSNRDQKKAARGI